MKRWIIAGFAASWLAVWAMGYVVIWMPDGPTRDNWKETVGLSVIGLIFVTAIGGAVWAMLETE